MGQLSTNYRSFTTLTHMLSVLRLHYLMIHSSDDDIPDQVSVTEINRLLQDLIDLAGQANAGPPVLELQIGEFLTRTAVERRGSDHYLSVTAALPKSQQSHSAGLSTAADGSTGQLEYVDFLWHADDGCYIVARHIPVRDLRDDRSVMDAILETADIAGKYQAALHAGPAA